jgi:hypothetical protein
MAPPNLTPDLIAGIASIGRLPGERFASLLANLQAPMAELSVSNVFDRLSPHVPQNEIGTIFAAIFALNNPDFDSVNTPQFFTEAVVDQGLPQAELVARLLALQSVRSVTALTRTIYLLTRNERNFLTAKVVTDSRPAFGMDLKAGVLGHALIHDLEIRWNGPDQNRGTFMISMDERDIEDLIAVLERAKQKAAIMKQQFTTNGQPYLVTNRFK